MEALSDKVRKETLNHCVTFLTQSLSFDSQVTKVLQSCFV